MFRFEPPDSTSVFSEMKQAVTDDDRSSLAVLVQKLRRDPPQDASVEKKLDRLGFRAILLGRPGMAVDILSLSVDLFPQSANAHDSLGEACWRNHDMPGAIRHYEKSLELDPQAAEVARDGRFEGHPQPNGAGSKPRDFFGKFGEPGRNRAFNQQI